MSLFLTKDELESYLNKLPNDTSKMNMTDASDTPDTPTPQQKSIHANPSLQKQASLKTLQDTHKPYPSQSKQDSTCPSCHKPIQGSVVSAMNTLWHASCFTCYKCNKTMEQEKYYQHKGHPYCYKDYKTLFSLTCDFCKKPIDTHAISALGKHYHQDHFCCTTCNKPFADGQFLMYKNQPYCEKDSLKLCGKKCFQCKEYLKDEYINAMGHEWHKNCFHCTVCKKPFSDGVFRVRDERPFCALHSNSDYHQETKEEPMHKPKKEPMKPTPTRSKKLNEQKMCHQCNEKIFGPCATALGHHYHIGHFQCVYCHRTLSSRVSAMWQGDAQGELACKQCISKQ